MHAEASTPTHTATQSDIYLRVLHALMLRDMRTRFGGKHIGWGVTIMWPVMHMLVIGTVMTIKGVPAPICGSTLLFIATGSTPVLAFQYISREVMKGLNSNKPLTYYPQVKKIDVMFARILIEIVGSFAGIIAVFTILYALGLDPMPVQPIMALCGYLTAVFFGIGVGAVNIGIVSVYPGWMMGYMFISIAMYIAAGVMFLPCFLPEQIYHILKYNPLLQIVEWVRLGYEPTLPVQVDYLYVLTFAGATLMVGLLLERFVVRQRAL